MAYEAAIKKILQSLLQVTLIFILINANKNFGSCAPSLSLQNDAPKPKDQHTKDDTLAVKANDAPSFSIQDEALEKDEDGHLLDSASPWGLNPNSALPAHAEDKVVQPGVQSHLNHNEGSETLHEIGPSNVAEHSKASIRDEHHELPHVAPPKDAVVEALKTLGLSLPASGHDRNLHVDKRFVEEDSSKAKLQDSHEQTKQTDASVGQVKSLPTQDKEKDFNSAEKALPLHPDNVVPEKLRSYDGLKSILLSNNPDPKLVEEIPSPKPKEVKDLFAAEQATDSNPSVPGLPGDEASRADYAAAAGVTFKAHPRARVARMSRILDDDAIRTYPTRSASSMLPSFPDSSSVKNIRPGHAHAGNGSDDYWTDETFVLDSNVFSAKDKTTDSTRGKTHLSTDGGALDVDVLESSKAHEISFGEQTVLFDNQEEVKVTGSKSGQEDERHIDGRGEQDSSLEKNIELTNARIESSITDRVILGNAKDEVESLVGNHKSIEATPTLKNELSVNTIVQPLEDSSHGTKGSHLISSSVFNADSTTLDATYETQRLEMATSVSKGELSNTEKMDKVSSDESLIEASSSLELTINSGEGSEPAPPAQVLDELTHQKNDGETVTESERASGSVLDSNHLNEILKSNLDVENKVEIPKSVISNSKIFETSVSHVIDDVPDVSPEYSDGSAIPVDNYKTERSPQPNLSETLIGKQLPEASNVKVISVASASEEASEHHVDFSNESLTTTDAATSDVNHVSLSPSNVNATTVDSELPNKTIGAEDSSTLQISDSLTSNEEMKTDGKNDNVIAEDGALEGDDGHTTNKSEESDVDKTAEGKQKDSIETYSQFAERVAMEKLNDGNGQSGATKAGGGSAASPNAPRLSAGKKYNNKNYAAPDCGSKLLAANPEAQHASSVIKRDRDDYLLNDCKSKTWFIVELCESIRPSRFEIANFELFSNLPKDVVVYGSQRYPSREWTLLGEYTGEPANRGVQAFPVTTEPFFKYIKVEILSHYGSEYYCPVSLFQVYGVSEFEVIDSMEDGSEEIEEEPVELSEPKKEEKKERSMFPTVLRSVLYNVLGALNKSPFFNIASKSNQTPPVDECSTLDPRYKIDEKKCSLAPTINWHLGCYDTEYRYLLKMPLIEQTVQSREFCKTLVDNLCTEKGNKEMIEEDIKEGKHVLSGSQVDLNYACSKEVCGDSYVCVMLCSHHLLALCHIKHFNLSASSSSSSNSSVSCEDANVPNNRSVNDKTDVPEVPSSNFVVKDAVIPDKGQVTELADKNIKKEADLSHVQDDAGSSIPQKDNASDTEGNKAELNVNLGNGKLASDVENEEPVATEAKKSPKKEKKAEGIGQDKKTSKNDQKKDVPSESKHGSNGVRNGDNGGSKNGNGSPLPTVEQDLPAPPKDGNGGNVAAAPVNKESVVVRLSNKIKALEHNLSINSQYLEELSQRYKQQMEEMQLQFSAAVSALNNSQPLPSASPEREAERDAVQEQVLQLQVQIQQLSEVVSQLSVEQEAFSSSVVQQHLLLMFVEVFLLLTTFWLCMRRQRRQISDQLYHRSSNQLSYTTRDALPSTDRDKSPPLHENCVPIQRQNGDKLLALQWADEKKDGHLIRDKKHEPLNKLAPTPASTLHRSGSADNSKQNKRRKRDRRASMHNLNIAGPFQDLLRDGSNVSSAKRKRRNKPCTKTCLTQPGLFKPSSNAHLLQKRSSETTNALFKDSTTSDCGVIDKEASQKIETTALASPSIKSWASKIDDQNSSPLKDSGFDWISEETKCGTSGNLLAMNALYDTFGEDIFNGLEDSAIVAEALEVAIKQGRKISKETLTRLLLAKMSNEKRIKLAKETRREANKRKNLNKSSAGVLFSCEKHSDKKRECPKKEQELPGVPVFSAQDCTVRYDDSSTANDCKIQPTSENGIRSCLPYVNFSSTDSNNSVRASDLLVTDFSQLMRISECSESSGILNTSLDTELLSDSSESPLHTVFSQTLPSVDPDINRRSSSAFTRHDLELEDLLIAMSRIPSRGILMHTSSLPEFKSKTETANEIEVKNVNFSSGGRDSDLYISSAIPIGDSLPKPVLVNGNHSRVTSADESGRPLSVVDGSKKTSNYVLSESNAEHLSTSIRSTLQNGSWMQVGGKSGAKSQPAKKKSGHKRTGSDGILSYNKKSSYNLAELKTNSNNFIEKKKNRKLKRNMDYGSLGESISSHCETSKLGRGNSSHVLSNVRRKSETGCNTQRLDSEKCRSAEEVRQNISAREDEGER